MKSFFASFFGSLLALIVFVFGGMFLLFVLFALIAIAGQASKTPAIEKGSFIVLDLSTNITDAPAPFEDAGRLGNLLGTNTNVLQLRELTGALRHAANDNRIGGLFITGNLQPEGYGSGFAALREVRQAIDRFRQSGKPVVAYAANLEKRDYYLMSAASEVVLHPFGILWIPGLAAEPVFFAGTLEKLGVGVQVTRAGKFKDYYESYVRRNLSPESREALQKLLDDLWGEIRDPVAASRKIEPANLQALLETPEPQRGEVALKNKLVDRVAYWDEVLADLKRRTGASPTAKTFKQVPIRAYAAHVRAAAPSFARNAKIAVVYAEGPIVDGDGEQGEVGGDRYARELRRLRNDDAVKAVVLRVNSPGGSVSASEVIERELRLLQKEKPLIVSMGTVAASGGYWISAFSDRIFAEPNTITGSIGVIAALFNVQELAGKIGVSFDIVKTGKFADMETISRPKTDEEMRAIQSLVDWLYDSFISRVAEGRKLDRAVVEEMAQGRVWSGLDAKRLGLIDEFGGLRTALDYAGEKAGLGKNYRIVEFPGKRDFGEFFRDILEKRGDLLSRGGWAANLHRQIESQFRAFRQFNDPRGLYLRLPVDIVVK